MQAAGSRAVQATWSRAAEDPLARCNRSLWSRLGSESSDLNGFVIYDIVVNMTETVILGRGGVLEAAPAEPWREEMRGVRQHMAGRLRFMTPDHERVRYFAVSEMIRSGAPLEPDHIARALQLAARTVDVILDELEQNLFFLVRDRRGRVTWAFPVTAEITPHRLRFSTGERIFA